MFSRLLLLPVYFMLPALTVAQTLVCTSLAGVEQQGSHFPRAPKAPVEVAASVCPDALGAGIQILPSDHVPLIAGHSSIGNQTLRASAEGAPHLRDLGSVTVSDYPKDASKPRPNRVTANDGTLGSGKDIISMIQTPEPGTMLLFGTGLLIAGAVLRRWRGNALGHIANENQNFPSP